MRPIVICCLVLGCQSSPFGGDHPGSGDNTPLRISSVTPTEGSVAGGTQLTIKGAGFKPTDVVTVGGSTCDRVQVAGADELSCVTGDHKFIEGSSDVVVSNKTDSVTLPAAFTYRCPWTTSAGRRSCGAAPAPDPASQMVEAWVTQFQAAHGFSPDTGPGLSNMEDTGDFMLGSQSAWIETSGTGTLRTISRRGLPVIDFTDRMPKLWIKVDNVEHMRTLDLVLGDSDFNNSYTFSLASSQGQKWTTEGDWVAFTVSWSPENFRVTGAPHRDAITDVMLRIADDQSGLPIRLHVNGIGLVHEPVAECPNGIVTFTFDDGFSTMVNPASGILASHGFAATAYVIVDMVDRPGRVQLDELRNLDAAGWDIAVHAATDAHHSARYVNLTAAEVEDDMVDARAWLMQQGFSGYNHCAYPGGAFTGGPDILSLAHRYFTSCRTIYERQHEALPPSDGRKLRVMYVTNDTSLATVEDAVRNARASREWLILVFHKILDVEPTLSTEWRASDFAALVQFVDSEGIPVRTVSDMLKQ